MPNNEQLSVYRDQIPLIPNFAMTDYNSQGRTRLFNVVDLHNCPSHQSMYTCLSRGSTYDGTVIIQGFNDKKIRGGISGFLRQEFRELEILDDITRLAFYGKLPETVGGVTREQLIYTYRRWKGEQHMPRRMPKQIQWSKFQPWENSEPGEDEIWRLVDKSRKGKDSNQNKPTQSSPKIKSSTELPFITAKGTNALKSVNDEKVVKLRKKTVIKTNSKSALQSYISSPVGFIWNNNSCAYDSVFGILYNIMQS